MIEININGVKLKVYENGDIEYFHLNFKHWRKASDVLNNGYKRIMLNQKYYKQHRIVYFAFHQDFDIDNPELLIDHINRFKNDNRLKNLRVVTNQQNLFNTNAKGYRFHKGKWEGSIQLNGKRIYKRFDTEKEAKNWHLEQKAILHLMPQVQQLL